MSHLALQLQTGPAREPVSLDMAKQWCRIDFPDDDTLILSLITAAREWVEEYCNRALFEQTWIRTLDNFPIYFERSSTYNASDKQQWPYWSDVWNQQRIDLPKAKTVSVNSITYIDSQTGDLITLDPSTYTADYTRLPCCVVPADGSYWPTETLFNPGSVTINFTAGSYGDGVDTNTCPQGIVTAILLLVSFYYNNREGSVVIPPAVFSCLASHRLMFFSYK